MKLRNLTPHELVLIGIDGAERRLAVDGPAPRLAVTRSPLGEMEGLPLVVSTLGEVEGLPPPEAGVVLVVSAMVAEARPGREDLAYPGEAIRNAAGRVVGAHGLCAGPGLARARRGAAPSLSMAESNCTCDAP